jgi:carbon-monoxide dehydrogenase small subunit
MNERTIRLTVNGRSYEKTVEVRKTLADFLREDLELTGTHLGCEHGVCGACTIIVNGAAVRSCLLFAAQMNGKELQTVEGLADGDTLNPLQQAFWEHHGLQCGFCTPGFLMTLTCFLRDNPDPTEEEIRIGISGNLCRCTGYKNIVTAARAAADKLKAAGGAPAPAAGTVRR